MVIVEYLRVPVQGRAGLKEVRYMEDKYSDDEKKLMDERKRISERIQQASGMLERLKGNLININAKLEYIQYRRKEEGEGPVEEIKEDVQ